MTNERYGNSMGQRKTGIHNPNETGPLEKLSITQESVTNPNLTLYERGEYLAEVIEYHMNQDPSRDAPYVLSCRPVDTHLGLANDISQLPLFYPIPSLYGQSIPAPGTIVKIRFDDLTNKSFGSYHGPESGINSRVKCKEIEKTAKKYETEKKDVDKRTSVSKPAASQSSPKDSLNNNKDTNLGKYCIEKHEDKKDKNKITGMSTSYSGCQQGGVENGKVILNIKGRGEVEKIIVRTRDSEGNGFWTTTEMAPAIERMKQDMERDLTSGMKITSLYRTQELQSCFWDRYKACLKKWKEAGEPGTIYEKNGVKNNLGKPAPAGPPSPIADGSHLSGEAIDLWTGVKREEASDILTLGRASGGKVAREKAKEEARIGKRFSKIWRWLLLNGEKYGFIWVGSGFNEPWHFLYSADLARKNGINVPFPLSSEQSEA